MNNQHQWNNLDFDNQGNCQTLNNILDDIKERNQFKGHQDTVNSASFSPDGKLSLPHPMTKQRGCVWSVRNLDRWLVDGCDWLKYYLQNPNVGLKEEDKLLCDDVTGGFWIRIDSNIYPKLST
jgi:hypothetical protein